MITTTFLLNTISLLTVIRAESWMTCPPSFDRNLSSRTATTTGPCESTQDLETTPLTQVTAGDRLKVGWVSKNTGGGVVRLSLVNQEQVSDQAVFDLNVLKETCFGSDQRGDATIQGSCIHPCNARPACEYQSDVGDTNRYDTTIKIPYNLDDGIYILQWTAIAGNIADTLYSCSRLEITGGDSSIECQAPSEIPKPTSCEMFTDTDLSQDATAGAFCFDPQSSGSIDSDISIEPVNINCDPRVGCAELSMNSAVCAQEFEGTDTNCASTRQIPSPPTINDNENTVPEFFDPRTNIDTVVEQPQDETQESVSPGNESVTEPEDTTVSEEQPVEEVPVEEGLFEGEEPVDEGPVEEGPVEEGPVEEGPVEEGPVEVEERPVEFEELVDEGPVEDGPVEFEGPVDEGPVEDGPVTEQEEPEVPEEEPFDEGPVEDGPIDDGPVEDGPIDDGPVEDGPVSEQEAPAVPEEEPFDEGPAEEDGDEFEPRPGNEDGDPTSTNDVDLLPQESTITLFNPEETSAPETNDIIDSPIDFEPVPTFDDDMSDEEEPLEEEIFNQDPSGPTEESQDVLPTMQFRDCTYGSYCHIFNQVCSTECSSPIIENMCEGMVASCICDNEVDLIQVVDEKTIQICETPIHTTTKYTKISSPTPTTTKYLSQTNNVSPHTTQDVVQDSTPEIVANESNTECPPEVVHGSPCETEDERICSGSNVARCRKGYWRIKVCQDERFCFVRSTGEPKCVRNHGEQVYFNPCQEGSNNNNDQLGFIPTGDDNEDEFGFQPDATVSTEEAEPEATSNCESPPSTCAEFKTNCRQACKDMIGTGFGPLMSNICFDVVGQTQTRQCTCNDVDLTAIANCNNPIEQQQELRLKRRQPLFGQVFTSLLKSNRGKSDSFINSKLLRKRSVLERRGSHIELGCVNFCKVFLEGCRERCFPTSGGVVGKGFHSLCVNQRDNVDPRSIFTMALCDCGGDVGDVSNTVFEMSENLCDY